MDSVRTAIERDAPVIRDGVAANDSLVHIGVVNDGGIHAHHRGVVCELSSAPLAAYKAYTHVAMAVVNSAVIPNAVAPVTVVKGVASAVPTPPGRGPESAYIRRRHPCPGNPVVAVIAIGPIPRRPHPAFVRAERLLINRKYRWSKSD
jgi:hypothetical protein